jgi:adenylyltransferase/sulfurtransferase
MYFTTIDIFKRPDCPVCQTKVIEPLEAKERLVWLCGRNTVNINPQKPLDVSLDEMYEALKSDFKIIVKSSLVIVFQYNEGIEVSLFNRGRMLIKNVSDEKSALKVYNKVNKKLGLKVPKN